MLVRIFDTNNWVRIILENNPMGMRALWNEVLRQKEEKEFKVFCFEGRGGNEKRRSLYPPYKKTREMPVDMFFENLNFFKELLRNAPKNVSVAWADGFEADDVINYLANQFKKATVEIMTTDRDLTQIEFAKFPMIKNELTDREFVRTYKTLVGDPSDNIKGLPRFGVSSWEKCRSEWGFLRSWCEACGEGVKLDVWKTNLPDKIKKLLDEADVNQVGVYWKITGFFPLNGKLQFFSGDGQVQLADEKMKEFLL